jgi:hypothetical protein
MSMNNMNQLVDNSYAGKFVGRVVFNDDPLKKQRIKVAIPNLLEAPVAQLPWFSPILGSTFGNLSDSNVMQVPALGSLVVVEFQDGDVHYGLYVGYVTTPEVQDDPELLVNYPKRRGWRDPAGNKLIIDYTGGQETVEFRHTSGTKILISANGDLEIFSVGDLITHATGNMTLQAGGSLTLQAGSTMDVQAGGSMSVQAATTMVVQAIGDLSLQSATHIGASAPRIDF